MVPKADVYYTGAQTLPNVVGPSLRRLLYPKRRFVVVVHHLIEEESRKRAGARSQIPLLAERLALKIVRIAATHVLPGSQFAKEQLGLLRFHPKRLTMTENAPSNRAIVESPPDAQRDSTVIYLGNLSKRKGAIDILSAWPDISRAHVSAKLLAIGQLDPTDAPSVRAALERAGPTATVANDLNDLQVATTLARASIFAATSLEEGWGIAVAEAMRAGLAAVTYDLPAYEPVFGRSTRLVVPIGDVRAFAAAVIQLLSDPKLRIDLARKGQEHVRRYSWQQIAAREAQFFTA